MTAPYTWRDRVRHGIVGDRPPPAPPRPAAIPRPLSDDDLASFMDAAQRHAGQATYAEMEFVLQKYAVSDWVRVAHIRSEFRWLARKARALGIEWTDLQ